MIHLCGKGNLDNKLAGITGYAQFEYANAELTDMFALADMAISRAGANSICELLALHKPNILIPLSALSLIHISEPTRQAEISYAVFCLKKKKKEQKRSSVAD